MTRRTKAQWCDLIEQQKVSGLSAAEFCRRHCVNAKYFSLRKQQLGGGSKPFVQVVPSAMSRPASMSKALKLRIIELELPQEALLESLSLLLDARRP